jgi:dienelactone hydrolase
MRTAGVDWRMNLYGGAEHNFTHPRAALAGAARLQYHQPSDERSWRAIRDLLDEVFG